MSTGSDDANTRSDTTACILLRAKFACEGLVHNLAAVLKEPRLGTAILRSQCSAAQSQLVAVFLPHDARPVLLDLPPCHRELADCQKSKMVNSPNPVFFYQDKINILRFSNLNYTPRSPEAFQVQSTIRHHARLIGNMQSSTPIAFNLELQNCKLLHG